MHKSIPTVVVIEYDPEWPRRFEDLRARIWPAVAGVADRIEHVGSTSVPGLAAKPIIDMTIVVRRQADVPPAIDRLATLGYRHLGNLDIEDREAFEHPAGLPRHHLYVCPEGTIGIVNTASVVTSLSPNDRRSPAPAAACERRGRCRVQRLVSRCFSSQL
jgi:GrpB-like predicted nucleotidyltransferase (UPF0157 family)